MEESCLHHDAIRSKKILYVADSLDNAGQFRDVLAAMKIDVSACSSVQCERELTQSCFDLVIYELGNKSSSHLLSVGNALCARGIPFLCIINQSQLEGIDLDLLVPAESDFVIAGASDTECAVRIRRLLVANNLCTTPEIVRVEGLTINLATYQVALGEVPIDLTYLEYALLAFLATHPSQTYSRDDLLLQVWGFDYYGGSRTVDVHVRRVRAKLGPDLAQHLETVRGVGYIWYA